MTIQKLVETALSSQILTLHQQQEIDRHLRNRAYTDADLEAFNHLLGALIDHRVQAEEKNLMTVLSA